MSGKFIIRNAGGEDVPALQAIYRPFVESTPISFELAVPSQDELARRVASAIEKWAWLVATVDGEVAGYAYGSTHRAREAYRFSVEVSAYVGPGHQRRGIARALYGALLPRLAARGYHNAYAGITLPNDASVGFHRSMGFRDVGVFPEVGFKFDAWHDVAWMWRPVAGG